MHSDKVRRYPAGESQQGIFIHQENGKDEE